MFHVLFPYLIKIRSLAQLLIGVTTFLLGQTITHHRSILYSIIQNLLSLFLLNLNPYNFKKNQCTQLKETIGHSWDVQKGTKQPKKI